VGAFDWEDKVWPLPQTGQMWLEYELLKNPKFQGVFCISTSYRNEPDPIEGRHKKIFPMFEFESHGDLKDLLNLEKELLEYLGFSSFDEISYENACKKYKTDFIKNKEETALCENKDAVFIHHFPTRTDPFWNMKYAGNGVFSKIDAIVMGQETIGSAERSTNKEKMRHFFDTIVEGNYRKKLYDLFGKERVEKELEEYFSLDFFPRFGGGIGVARLISGLNKKNYFL
jgi:aspartyl/asparaginyl-tRNA synthetase